MLRALTLFAALALGTPAFAAEQLPTAIDCYRTATNGQDIDAYMACFTEDAVMIDVSRTFEGQDAIRTWALREVISGGSSFKHRKILEADEGYAMTEVNWSAWVAHYSYWWDADGKITKMSLRYAD